MTTTIDPVMRRFRAALDEAYGDRIERVVLFGSRARGDARPDSDYDVAVFVRGMNDCWREARVLAEIETNILMDEGAVINALPLPEGSYRERTIFMDELRREGHRSVKPEVEALPSTQARGELSDARKAGRAAACENRRALRHSTKRFKAMKPTFTNDRTS